MSKTVSEILFAAADLIEPEGAWTQEAEARDASGEDLEEWDYDLGDPPPAVCWCAARAIWEQTGLFYSRDPAVAFFADFLGVDDIPDWNDAPERTQAEVVAKLREAAALARESGQ